MRVETVKVSDSDSDEQIRDAEKAVLEDQTALFSQSECNQEVVPNEQVLVGDEQESSNESPTKNIMSIKRQKEIIDSQASEHLTRKPRGERTTDEIAESNDILQVGQKRLPSELQDGLD